MLGMTVYSNLSGIQGKQLVIDCFGVEFSEIGVGFDVDSGVHPRYFGGHFCKFGKEVAVVVALEFVGEFDGRLLRC